VTQILINLLSNALKYSPGGVVTLGAHLKADFLEVSIADQGPGIAPEQRAVLFSRFGRAPGEAQGAGSRAKPTGTGLGLFLTKHLVESHGGLIWVESETGQGATFRFTLPLAPRETESPD
jgi:signal transduction histidine kinase